MEAVSAVVAVAREVKHPEICPQLHTYVFSFHEAAHKDLCQDEVKNIEFDQIAKTLYRIIPIKKTS